VAPGRATSIIEKEELKMNRVPRMKRKIKREREKEISKSSKRREQKTKT